MPVSPPAPTRPVASRHVVIVFTDAGGGHRAAAENLRDILEAEGATRVTLVNAYRRVLPHLDLFARLTRRTVDDTYNDLVLKAGRTGLFCLGFFALAALNVALLGHWGRRAFGRLWQEERPDLVVSVLPMINHLIAASLADDHRARMATGQGRRVPLAILITDWSEVSPGVWFPRRTRDWHALCGTADALAQVRRAGHPEARIHPTTGLLIRPAFVDPPPLDRAAARRALGLDPDRPVACMLYGGQGGVRMRELAEALRDRPPDLQVLFLCGRNDALARDIAGAALPYPHVVLGFTPDVARLMALSDLFIGKTGPQSVSEALAFGLPLLIDRQKVMPQERAVLRYIVRSGLGQTFATPAECLAGLRHLVAAIKARGDATGLAGIDKDRTDPTGRARRGGNRAAREIPAILDQILAAAD